MLPPPRLPEVPDQGAIRDVLGQLSAMPRGWWIVDNGQLLMGLDCTQRCVRPKPTSEEDYADAVRSYLDIAVGKVASRQHRVILEVVLGLGDEKWRSQEWRSKSLGKRREEAGRLFRGAEGGVKGGTIRQIHEPRAIEELAAIVWHDEKVARGESIDNAGDR